MTRQEKIADLEATVGVAIGVVLSEQTSAWVGQWFSSRAVTVASAVAVVVASTVLARFIGSGLFVRSRALRRLLLGRQYVEGVWFDVMHKDGEVVEVGFSRIRYTASALRFSGEDYDLQLEKSSPYRADMIRLEWPTLRYVYSAARPDDESEKVRGYGYLTFDETRSGAPRKYTGKYFPLRHTEGILFYGIRLDEKKEAACLARLDDPARVAPALRDLLSRLGPGPRAPSTSQAVLSPT